LRQANCAAGVRPATATGIIDTLAKAGYVRRERDPSDRRAVWVVITETGGARVDEIGSELTETFSPAVTVDPERERIIREFLIELLITYRSRETFDESQRRRPGGRARGRPSEAVPET
jgi:DNA-binding MarR family transcriptional regulator